MKISPPAALWPEHGPPINKSVTSLHREQLVSRRCVGITGYLVTEAPSRGCRYRLCSHPVLVGNKFSLFLSFVYVSTEICIWHNTEYIWFLYMTHFLMETREPNTMVRKHQRIEESNAQIASNDNTGVVACYHYIE